MEKQDNYLLASSSLSGLDYSAAIPASSGSGMVDYMLNQAPPPDHRFAFSDVLQFADFGPRLALHHHSNEPEDSGHVHTHDALVDPVYMLKFPVLNEQPNQDNQVEFVGACSNLVKKNKSSGKRKRARIVKTTEEAESQRMTHIAVERNRRKQMNEHLRVLRSLMPNSYVQRGDQASIVGGAIEFVRELEELLQCLESQKRRKLYGEASALPNSQSFDPNSDQIITINDENTGSLDGLMMVAPNVIPAIDLAGLQEETAENKSAIADIEVKLLGFDAFIKILSRRRPGQLIKAISGLQDLQFTILHTNVTTIEQTVLYSFNIKISSETRFSAEDIASSVQQIFTFIHANYQDM